MIDGVLGDFLLILGIHWVADFVFQTSWQAANKSKNNVALSRHVGTYTATIGLAIIALFGLSIPVISFIIFNGVCHFITDYITSRVTSRLFAQQDWHTFFVVVGCDQLIHQVTLGLSLIWLTAQ